jgi:cAMP-dependent protein kinase regulator
MAQSTFPGLAGASSNPFGAAGGILGSTGVRGASEDEENDTVGSPTTPNFRPNTFGSGGVAAPISGPSNGGGAPNEDELGPIGGSSSSFRPPATQGDVQGFPANYGMGRRTSVSAESMNPTSSLKDNWAPPFHQKTPEQWARLQTAISGNFLFSHLDDEQSEQVLGALVEKPIRHKDMRVITQGDTGDFFYVVEKGTFDVYINPTGTVQPGPDGLGNKVASIQAGGSFGELALMYNAPRAATVISAESDCTLWALDRVTFRRILMDSTFQRRRMYESFLEEVPLLSDLTPYERSKIADALDTQKFQPGTTIIQEGDPGEAFFILESGEADAYKRGVDKPVASYKKGDYFGELALLNDAPRAATVVSRSEVKLATLGKDGFQRLLGPVESIMRRNDPSKRGTSEEVDPLAK